MTANTTFETIIIGGSYAGLSAAMALGRSLRNILIIDSGNPCNSQTPHSHNFLTQDGKTPHEIAELARKQVEQYDTVQFYNGFAETGTKTEDSFYITTRAGDTFNTKKVIFATGIKDQMPAIEGFAECWGISIIHCPYCHGYEYRHRKTGILANGDVAFHYAQLVSNLTKNLTVFTNGTSALSAEQTEKLKNHNIPIVETEVARVEHEKGHLQNLVLQDGSKVPLDALYAHVWFEQHSEIPASLGCEFTEQGFIKVDAGQHTTVPGVLACGDNSSMMRSVANAVASGNLAGAMVNRELTQESF